MACVDPLVIAALQLEASLLETQKEERELRSNFEAAERIFRAVVLVQTIVVPVYGLLLTCGYHGPALGSFLQETLTTEAAIDSVIREYSSHWAFGVRDQSPLPSARESSGLRGRRTPHRQAHTPQLVDRGVATVRARSPPSSVRRLASSPSMATTKRPGNVPHSLLPPPISRVDSAAKLCPPAGIADVLQRMKNEWSSRNV